MSFRGSLFDREQFAMKSLYWAGVASQKRFLTNSSSAF